MIIENQAIKWTFYGFNQLSDLNLLLFLSFFFVVKHYFVQNFDSLDMKLIRRVLSIPFLIY